MMKRLRILTGRHAGAFLDLDEGLHRVGHSDDCDVVLSDWPGAPLQLEVKDGSVSACHTPGPQDTDAVARCLSLPDWQPQDVDGIVLCCGPVDQAWPRDVELLEQVFAPTPLRMARWARGRMRQQRRDGPRGGRSVVGWSAAALAALVGLGLVVRGHEAPAAEPPPNPAQAAARLQALLRSNVSADLVVQADGDTLVVRGKVADAAQAVLARQTLENLRSQVPGLGHFETLPRFAVASEVTDALRGTDGLRHAQVTDLGAGVYRVQAEVRDEAAARDQLQRVASDLAPAVKRLELQLTLVDQPDPIGPILSRTQDDGVTVVQTRDGVKHLVLRSLPPFDTDAPPDDPPQGLPQPKPQDASIHSASSLHVGDRP